MKNVKQTQSSSVAPRFANFQAYTLCKKQQQQLKGGDDFIGEVDDVLPG